MKRLFRNKPVFILSLAVLLSVGIVAGSALAGDRAGPLSAAANVITTPVRAGVSKVMDWAEGAGNYAFHYNEMKQELTDLRKQVADLQQQVRRGQEASRENEQLRELLNLQAKHQDFVFESARITEQAASNWDSTLTLSKGSSAGVKTGNCVVSETGVLIGVVDEVGPNYCRVNTVIDPDFEMGGFVVRTFSAGVLEGDFTQMSKGCLKLSYLSEQAKLVAGDEVATSGKGGIYPPDLVVGKVESVFSDPSGLTRYAVISPSVDLRALTEVFIIKDFTAVE